MEYRYYDLPHAKPYGIVYVEEETIFGNTRKTGVVLEDPDFRTLFDGSFDTSGALPYPDLFWKLFQPEDFPDVQKYIRFEVFRWPSLYPCASPILNTVFTSIGTGIPFFNGAVCTRGKTWDMNQVRKNTEERQRSLHRSVYGDHIPDEVKRKSEAFLERVWDTYPLTEDEYEDLLLEKGHEDLEELRRVDLYDGVLLLDLPKNTRIDWVCAAKAYAQSLYPERVNNPSLLKKAMDRMDLIWPDVDPGDFQW